MSCTEFDLIDHIRSRQSERDDVVLGIGDDAAILRLPERHQLIVSTDTSNVDVHFLPTATAFDIGWKTLAVNLSDLAAMGAVPAWCTLSLSLPKIEIDWIDRFLDGFFSLAGQFDVALVGGDTTRGSLSIAVTVLGWDALPGMTLKRDRARVGDDVWVTGTLGDAAAALQLMRERQTVPESLANRLARPCPRVHAGRSLLSLAHACIDVSDGVLADLGHICRQSHVGAEIFLDALPASTALQRAFDPNQIRNLQLGGGDDYELCFTAPTVHREAIASALSRLDVSARRIGEIIEGDTVFVCDAQGMGWVPSDTGYEHFA